MTPIESTFSLDVNSKLDWYVYLLDKLIEYCVLCLVAVKTWVCLVKLINISAVYVSTISLYVMITEV